MSYDLFFFDLDDTLLNFRESERLSFYRTLQDLGIHSALDEVFKDYQVINRALWSDFEQGKTSKDLLKVERFRRVFEAHKVELDPVKTSDRYLEMLPETVVLMDYAVELCQWVAARAELGIVTNGMSAVQMQRISRSAIAPYISFVSVSEECGFAKPDVRFFEYSSKRAKKFNKSSSLVVGDRLETDIQGAHDFGLDSAWFNQKKEVMSLSVKPKFEVYHLSELQKKIEDLE